MIKKGDYNEIRVFIASSAELDQDKEMFDLYFSDKNKLYRKERIVFDHRTWKDFSSSLNEGRLQDRYNDFIRECDLVIFLFHTRLGRYTREELEVASAAFRRNGRRPRIFVYFKEEGIEDDALRDFKEYCEKRLGHFCDVYATYDDWHVKFDRQLKMLEEEGFIRAPRKRERMAERLKFAFSHVLAPAVVVCLAILVGLYFVPVTVTVCLDDRTPSSLPFQGAEITLVYADKSESQQLDRLTDEAIFKQIHARYVGRPVQIAVSSPGYEPVDTLLDLEKRLVIPIRRDASLSLLYGTVKDENNRPLAGVTLQVLDLQTVSDETGSFRLRIPSDRQRPQQRVQAFKEGYELWDFTGPVSDTVPWKIILHRR